MEKHIQNKKDTNSFRPENIIKICLIFSIFLAFLLSAFYVFHNDIIYDADIARDFLILEEIQTKKLILIGQRSGAAPGFFHGPLWSYLNFPAFYLGGGNPVIVGWFWVILNSLFLLSCFYISKKLFNPITSYFFTFFISVRMIGFTRGFFNPSGAILLVPLFIYLLIVYTRTTKLRYLIAHIIAGGMLIQFQIAIGAPFMVLSFVFMIYRCFKIKNYYSHLLAYFLLFITLSSYLIFDFRHDFLMTKAIVNYLTVNNNFDIPSILYRVNTHLRIMISNGLLFFKEPYIELNYFLAVFMILYLCRIFLKKISYQFLIFWYFYTGFYILSVIHKGGLGIYYYFPLFSLSFLIYFSLEPYINKKLFYSLTSFLLIFNLYYEINSLNNDVNSIGKRQMSWQFHNHIAERIFKSATNREFGIFLYSPDIQGYRSKYPLVYQQKLNTDKKMYIFEKKPETFVLSAGLPEYSLPWGADPEGFKREIIKINKPPLKRWQYNDGYSVEEFYLTEEERKIPFEANINNWLHFR